MNISELSRQVKIPVQELKLIIPELGFDVGQKAIQVDGRTAVKIIEQLNNPIIKEKMLAKLKNNQLSGGENLTVRKNYLDLETSTPAGAKNQHAKISVGETIVVKDLANQMNLPITKLILELMKNGVMASLNQKIDFETASIIADDLGFSVEKNIGEKNNLIKTGQTRAEYFIDDPKNMVPRPPVVVVMGHVDHGKTKLLDAIRETNLVDAEAGGITQHIGAYQTKKNDQSITFIDTPGHEAFSAMRSRGAQVADIAILVVAADDGIMPQTIEAISHIRSANLPMVVAINKIDKPEANLDKIKSGLAEIGLTPEDWGGETICVPISAKQKTNIDLLLENLLLVYEMEKEKIVANPKRNAIGTIIEAHLDKGEGPVATVLVQTGTLKISDSVKIGSAFGKIRTIKDWRGKNVAIALPSTPVKIVGLKATPEVGEILQVLTDQKEFKKEQKKFKNYKAPAFINTSKHLMNEQKNPVNGQVGEKENVQKINIILKADVLGSLEAIVESLVNLNLPDLVINIVQATLGNITAVEIERAAAQNALILGFNVKPNPAAEQAALEQKVVIKTAKIIYELIDFIKEEMKKNIKEEIIEEVIGQAKVLKIFRTEKKTQIIGAKITAGKITKDCKIKIIRNNELMGKATLAELQSGRQTMTEVVADQEAGLKIEGFNEAEENDQLEIYKEQKIVRKI